MPECHLKDETCQFKCTGFSNPKAWPSLHEAIDKNVDCEECNQHGHFEIDALHDHIGLALGKKVFDKKKYDKWFKEVKCVYDTCKEQGRC